MVVYTRLDTVCEKKADFPNVTSIRVGAFDECSNLKKADFPSVTSIEDYAFYGCSNLKKADFPNVTSIGKLAFYECNSLTEVNIPRITEVYGGTFYNCTSLSSLNLPTCTIIGDYQTYNSNYRGAFQGCSQLSNVVLPEVTYIGSYAFRGCSSLQNICMPNITSIGDYAFYDCQSLKELNLPNVTSIGSYAFNGGNQLTNPVITSTNLTNIGDDAFSTFGTLTLMSNIPIISNANAVGENTILVPDSLLNNYRTADVWKEFANRILSLSAQREYDVTVSALSNHSALHDAIGEENLNNVVSLKITGDINGYDIMVLRNKTDNLHYLDLTDANIVANAYEYISGKYSQNDVMDGLSGLNKLLSVKLPKSIKSIASNAFSGCI